MIDIARDVARIRSVVLASSALAWVALLAGPGMLFPYVDVYCSATGSRTDNVTALLSLLLALSPPSSLGVGWALMLTAMMSPLLVAEIHHVWFTSLKRRRARSIALFVVGYGGLWMLWGAALMAAAFLCLILMPRSVLLPASVALIACIWQASPIKQLCLNRCHVKPPLRAFGREADLDAFRFGWTHGFWCAGSCTAWMLLALVMPEGHLVAMAAIALLVFCERLEDPQPPTWKMRGLGKAGRMIVAWTRLRWRMVRYDPNGVMEKYRT